MEEESERVGEDEGVIEEMEVKRLRRVKRLCFEMSARLAMANHIGLRDALCVSLLHAVVPASATSENPNVGARQQTPSIPYCPTRGTSGLDQAASGESRHTLVFDHVECGYSNLFRISDFDLSRSHNLDS